MEVNHERVWELVQADVEIATTSNLFRRHTQGDAAWTFTSCTSFSCSAIILANATSSNLLLIRTAEEIRAASALVPRRKVTK